METGAVSWDEGIEGADGENAHGHRDVLASGPSRRLRSGDEG